MSKKKLFFSSTAEMTCLFRAKSFGETRQHFKGDDFIAVMICYALNSFLSLMHKSFLLNDEMFNASVPPGAYEYILGRTNFLDNIFMTLPADCKQVFILGAGFDSRCCRFQQQLRHCQVYEVDHPDMQQQKRAIFKKIDIDFPANVHFIAIDFSRQRINEILTQRAIPRGEKCFFVLEGLTYYLEAEQVEAIFTAISRHGGPGSQVFFDYVDTAAIAGENSQYGLQECVTAVRKLGEARTFGIEADKAAQFLAPFHFDIIEQLTSREMEEQYFTDEHHNRLAKTMSSLTLVRAQRV
ncbi:class I SAM-dependent methyltransferase [Sodalis sp. RH22]|uniref:class I SAM-dependent methyltransferase n=1 Tax=unclassified Sodalis (in: enterobacteria) TaxID=2636512 RepID=UPI0039B3ABDC